MSLSRLPGIVAVLWLMSAHLAAQGLVVPLERAAELKRSYPFVRFLSLASFDLPLADGFVHSQPASRPTEPLVIPAEVLALHGKASSIRGFMLPIDVTSAGVKTFILTSSIDSCHWGLTGLPNEWVLVEMNARVPFLQFQPVTIFGRLSVEPSYRAGRLSGLYQMRGEFLSADGL